MAVHRIGAATLAATLLAAPVSAQTTATDPDRATIAADAAAAESAPSEIRTRLGLPAPTAGGGHDAALFVFATPGRVADASRAGAPLALVRSSPERRDDGPRSVVFRQQAEPLSWPWGWTLRGFVGGLLAGPVGTGVAFHMAGKSDVSPPQVAAGNGAASATIDPAFIEAVRSRRKEATFVGGMIGTAAFLYATLVVLDIDGSGDASIVGDPRDPGPGF